VGGTPEQFARKREVLHAHCQEVGRNPEEILLSSHVMFDGDPAAAAAAAAALGEVGVQLGIVHIRPPHDPAVLEPLATALAELR
jgi:alkanesulfonate monooxygenase SsuD/methylene tetrahydromethanopterin reductase-like flavin-dependent oxidoreductase (luciferase family)